MNGDIFYKEVEYKKINNDDNLDSLENLLNMELPFLSYKMYKMHACFVSDLTHSYSLAEKYVYFLYEINGYTSKANIYYALKENKTPIVIENVDGQILVDGNPLNMVSEETIKYIEELINGKQ